MTASHAIALPPGYRVADVLAFHGRDPERVAEQVDADGLRKGVLLGGVPTLLDIRFGDNLPKTRSGKIMRRLLRSIARGEPIVQDTSTLENPAILEQLSQAC